MKIREIINNSVKTEDPIVLNSVWTDNKEFCCDKMGEEQMLLDMVECQDLIKALYLAEEMGIAIPKLKASEDLSAFEYNGWRAINTDIMGPVTDDFVKICDSVNSSHDAHDFIFSIDDNIKIINKTMTIG